MAGISVLILLVLMVLSLPLFASFAFASSAGIIFLGLPTTQATNVGFFTINSFPLMAVPLFILAGNLMAGAGITNRLVDWVNAVLGGRPSGLPMVVVGACAFFGAISGSGVAAVAAIGGIMLPKMVGLGYEKKFTTALICVSSVLAILIPPSIPLILYGVAADQSIGALFLATVIPGLIMAVLLLIVNLLFFKNRLPAQVVALESADGEGGLKSLSLPRATVAALPALVMPLLVLGGIYGGVFTPTEAAGVAATYSLLMVPILARKTPLGKYKTIFTSSVNTTAVVLTIMYTVMIFSRYLTILGLPAAVSSLMLNTTDNPMVLLLLIAIFLLLLGMFIDPAPAILVATPLLLPLVNHIGLNLIQFGSIMAVAMAIGLVSPPVAPCLYVGCRISGLGLFDFIRELIPYIVIAGIPVLALVILFPELSLWLPRAAGFPVG